MNTEIVIADADKKACRALNHVLENRYYQTASINSLNGLKQFLKKFRCRVMIIDLDTLPVDKRFFRDLKRLHPMMNIIGLSKQSFHPELEEAISQHIFACVNKPVDPEEIIFLLKSINEQNGY
jgi:DNA-binding NtrC family response regulator